MTVNTQPRRCACGRLAAAVWAAEGWCCVACPRTGAHTAFCAKRNPMPAALAGVAAKLAVVTADAQARILNAAAAAGKAGQS